MAGKLIQKIFSKPLLKRAVKTVFPDPMDNYRLELMLWDFKKQGTTEEWVTITDKQFGGLSTAEFVTSKSGKALFRGNLSTEVPEGSEAKHSGICAIRSQPRVDRWGTPTPFDTTEFDGIQMKFKGDGRTYALNIQPDSVRSDDLHQSFLYTRGGPYWETVRVRRAAGLKMAYRNTNYFTEDKLQQIVKEQLNSIINQLQSTGLVVHVLQNKVVISQEPKDEFFTVVDGEEALKFVNNPRYADKIICVDDQKFYCHSNYLVLRSEYFRALFQGDFKETSMDLVSIDLPTPGNFEPILKFLYTGIASEKDSIFGDQEIFRVISNSDFLGIKELSAKAVTVFAHKWRVLTKSTMFRRSIIDYNFLDSVLDYGTKNALFKNGEKLKLLVLWDEEDKTFTETNRLIIKHQCFEEATITDLEWAMKVNPNLFSNIDSLNFKSVFNRALGDAQRAREDQRQNEEKIRRLTQCVKVLRSQLDEVSCNRCRTKLPRAAIKTRTCVTMQHSGRYLLNEGWTCCGELLKRSRGCKPVSLSRHRIHSH